MEEVKRLNDFYIAIQNNNRISTSHISLYMAIFQLYNLNGFQNPVEVTRASLMRIAKISGLATYHKCIKDLVEFEYVRYEPSFNPAINSRVYLLDFYGN